MRALRRAAYAGIALLAQGGGALALDQFPAAAVIRNPPPSSAQAETLSGFFSAKTPYEFWLTCIILLAGLIFACLAIRFLRQIHREELENATSAMTILFVIMATMVLITAGYNNEQIAPAFGLFGTIIGYILGRREPGPQAPGPNSDEPVPPPVASSPPPGASDSLHPPAPPPEEPPKPQVTKP